MACEECALFTTHAFRSADDLLHALRLAGEEMERGVLARADARPDPGTAEAEALQSAFDSGARPDAVRYRFRCRLCGDGFTLAADMTTGEGSWTRDA